MNVSVFKTTVPDSLMVAALKQSLDDLVGSGNWTFDLNDCDRVFRIIKPNAEVQKVINLLNRLGVECEELSD